ncbi:MAG: PspA/IM30 family protein [Nitrococcus sp.]|nr:PspA/IM30 family protein [Nitrococcus sp.]
MMNLFRRLLKLGESEAHSMVDRLEDPVRMSEQAIRDLREELRKAMEALAEVKAITIRSRREQTEARQAATDYEHKAVLLLEKAERGELEATEADRLATESLQRKAEHAKRAGELAGEVEKYERMTADLEHKVRDIRHRINQWENELRTLKARARVSSATKKLNRELADIDTTSTVSTLQRMKEKVAQEEAMAEAYGQVAAVPRSVDHEIDSALGGPAASSDVGGDLAALKARLANKSSK